MLVLAGSLTAGPPTGGSTFPDMTVNGQLGFDGGSRNSQACTGTVQRTINSPSAYVALPSIGVAGDVQTADFFYLRSAGPIQVEVTAQDGSGGSTVNVVSCAGGPLMLPVAPNLLITGIRVKGSAQIEYLASGPA
jgi:hypothetical protein